MSIPSVGYLEAMEAGRYQQAVHDDEMQDAVEEGDALAKAFLLVAAMHRDAAVGDASGAVANAEDAMAALRQEVDDGWTRKALVQHVEQCTEYLSMGKPLPNLPSGL